YGDVLDVDRDSGRVTVEAGIRLHDLNDHLADHGLAMANLGDINVQTLAGAISTATHGTGARLGNIATQVAAMELITADGSVVHCSPDEEPEVFQAARVGLGALGIVSKVTLQCVPAFNLSALEEPARLDDLLDDLDALADGHDHFEFFWFPHTEWCITKRNTRTDEPVRPRSAWKAWRDDMLLSNYVYDVVCRIGRRRPERIPDLARYVTSQLGRVRMVDRSDKIFASPRVVKFNEMEYAIPRAEAAGALRRLREVIDEEGFLVNFPVEVRFVAADDIFLSPSTGRDTCYIAVHLYKGMDFEPYFRAVEAIMQERGGRPHWGKLHFREAPDLEPAYPDWGRFQAVRRRLDPDGRFANAYTERVLGPLG
ncbi:MAG TPA: D-arabinono-1,4-lactone oxidase, partial [Acidimicrobiia bacterium]|nr:D-arabinono-1,4-lactone oxidase [Acidimicrobiia bacterium]